MRDDVFELLRTLREHFEERYVAGRPIDWSEVSDVLEAALRNAVWGRHLVEARKWDARRKGPSVKHQKALARRVEIRQEVRRIQAEKPHLGLHKTWLQVSAKLRVSLRTVKRAMRDASE